jgi:hypothetical protein
MAMRRMAEENRRALARRQRVELSLSQEVAPRGEACLLLETSSDPCARARGVAVRGLGETRAAILQLASQFSAIRAVYLFGSVLSPDRFRPDSGVDVAIDTQDRPGNLPPPGAVRVQGGVC